MASRPSQHDTTCPAHLGSIVYGILKEGKKITPACANGRRGRGLVDYGAPKPCLTTLLSVLFSSFRAVKIGITSCLFGYAAFQVLARPSHNPSAALVPLGDGLWWPALISGFLTHCQPFDASVWEATGVECPTSHSPRSTCLRHSHQPAHSPQINSHSPAH